MSIEDDLLNNPASHNSKHKTMLRARLLEHMKDTKKKPRLSFWSLVAAVPVAALLVFGIFALAPVDPHGSEKGKGGIVQKTLSPLTAARVFAEAEKQVPTKGLQPGQYYYLKMHREHVGFNQENTCDKRTDISEFYYNDRGVAAKTVRYTADGKLFQIATTSEDGQQAGPEFFWDEALSETTKKPFRCPELPNVTQHEYISVEEADRRANDPVHRAISNLSLEMPTPAQQKEAFQLLQKTEGWKVTEHVTIAYYDRPVIQLEYKPEGAIYPTYFYFDQQTKQYAGMRWNDTFSVVLEQDIRVYKSHPEHVHPAPEQR